MTLFRFAATLTLISLACACNREQRATADGAEHDDPTETVSAGAEAKAEDGKVSISGPGFKMKVDIPNDNSSASVTSGSDIVYPGAAIRGMSVDANAESGASSGKVAIRFASPDPVDKVVAWYRSPARNKEFAVASSIREGDGYRLEGTAGEGHFAVALSPESGGGTAGELTLSGGS